MGPEISVVIPTYNRKESLFRLLRSLQEQSYLTSEVIIVDASVVPLHENDLKASFPKLNIIYMTSIPGVCKQRNLGINAARSPYIFLCDDDIEVPTDYLSQLSAYLSAHPHAGVVTGYVLQKNKYDVWSHEYPVTSFKVLLWNFIFQLTVWGSIDKIKTNFFTSRLLVLIRKFYHTRGNTYTLAGWPLITDFTTDVIRTTIYGLGASIIKRDWLIQVPFDESLGTNGIGDNYGIAINFPDKQPVHILTKAFIFHHQVPENRLKATLSYQQRIFALAYFMKRNPRFRLVNRLFLYWSLIGNMILQLIKLQSGMAKTTFITLFMMIFDNNPYRINKY